MIWKQYVVAEFVGFWLNDWLMGWLLVEGCLNYECARNYGDA